ncbi:uncharacterized protein M421DRAFT_66351 [Didymella exigua CBS 183.55]|uniref:Uncharacterized protein n=1 Tax=Didymella exigua CBS 183.55 TaxID=1150837 RepID=A0A6A5RHE1_9PLEO|nr:uncharacterized protein M421DRAFT_66351 [Didymella exigua CBS 183.55]KAF1926923.1 hypothetical protein M421DRAFT_66351 [Didymella exigua CBS 183.55]
MSANNSHPDPRSTIGLAGYPSTGAFSHLPIRTTITGDAIVPHPNANKIFLRNLPGHCYTLPKVSLNFTLVEIVVLLPNWFKNKAIAMRFISNHLTANVHFAIFEEHRECNFKDDHEREKAKKTITDEYRKTMRSYPRNMGWTKAKHTAPLGWNPTLIAMDGFVPEDAHIEEYRRPPSIPLRDLMIGVKKLPEDTKAGDLTRCVQFALGRTEDFMFPDDLSQILEHIGRTQITLAHTDRPIVRAYVDHMRKESDAKRSPPDRSVGPSVEERIACEEARWEAREAAEQMQVQRTAAKAVQQHLQPPPQIMTTTPDGHAKYQPQSAAIDRSSGEMEALLYQYVHEGFQVPTTPASPPTPYHPRCLLRECVEGHVAFDGSPLARAARFAQQPDQISTEWYVENVALLVQLLDAAPHIEVGI